MKVLVLAIGIGAVSLMFSTLNTVVLRPLPFADPDRLVWLWGTSEASRRITVSAADYFDYRRDFKTFDSLAAYLTFRPATLLAADNEPERIVYTLISHNLLATLGVQPQLGRTFRPDEEAPGGTQVVMVSHGFWQRRLGGEAGVIGRVLTLAGEPWEIVGVMPADFEFPEDVELWFPMRGVDYHFSFHFSKSQLGIRSGEKNSGGTRAKGRNLIQDCRARPKVIRGNMEPIFPVEMRQESD